MSAADISTAELALTRAKKFLAVPTGRDPADCEHCDGFGMCWNNADPTSGQWVECDACGDTGLSA